MLAHLTFAEGPLSEVGISLGTLQVCFKPNQCWKASLSNVPPVLEICPLMRRHCPTYTLERVRVYSPNDV
jgi:hypothetical protein